jgi:hypothetical protein
LKDETGWLSLLVSTFSKRDRSKAYLLCPAKNLLEGMEGQELVQILRHPSIL